MKKALFLSLAWLLATLPVFSFGQNSTIGQAAPKPPRFDPKTAVVATFEDGRMRTALSDSLLIESAQKGIPWLGRVDKIRFEKNGSQIYLVFWGWQKDDPLGGFNASLLLKPGEGNTFILSNYTSCCRSLCSTTCGSGAVACGQCPEGGCESITSSECMMAPLESKN